MTQHAELMLRLSKAKTSLILEHPFVGSIAMSMPFIIDDSINPPTAMTNGKEVRFHPDFCNSLTQQELVFLVAHECMHPMLEHTIRRRGRDGYKWNVAADYVINKLLVDEKIGTMPKQGLLDQDIYQRGDGTAEGIYAILPPSQDGGSSGGLPGGGSGGAPLDNIEEPDDADKAEQEAIWKVKIAQGAQAARMCGKLSTNFKRLVESVLKPKVDWRDVLARFLVRARTDERSWARPNRRFIAQGMYLPSVSGTQMGEIVVAVDCSGSIRNDEIDQFAAEIRSIHYDLMPAKLHVIYFDSKVKRADTFGTYDDVVINPKGGGGTAFSPVFKHIDAEGIQPVACVVLTDLCCDDFGLAPDYPVLWVSTDGKSAPFGEVVMM